MNQTKIAAIVFSGAGSLFAVAGGFIEAYRYWLVFASVCCASAAFMLLLRSLALKMWALECNLEAIPLQVIKRLPSEIHAMEVILKRFPECSIPTTNWSMRFANLLTILDVLDTEQPQIVVEFGSGASTMLVAAWMKERSSGRLLSFDHDPEWMSVTQRHLVRQDLNEYVDLFPTPLTHIQSGLFRGEWYDISTHLEGIQGIDLVIIDGPPAGSLDRHLARAPAIEQLYSRLSPDCVVVLDDAFRPGEQKVLSNWSREFAEFSVTMIPTATGLALLRRTGHSQGKMGVLASKESPMTSVSEVA